MEVDDNNAADDEGEAMNETILDATFETATNAENGEGKEEEEEEEIDDLELDCYPYTFSPLLLFAESSYFDRGYSNYNSVAQFFSSVLRSEDGEQDIDMLQNVLYDRKNMLYEELLNHVIDNEMLVTCCIDAHFTAFKMFKQGSGGKVALLHYDPQSPHLGLATGDQAKRFALFKMMKCNYGDGQHIQDNKDHYTGGTGMGSSASTRRTIYNMWKKIHQVDRLFDVKFASVRLNLDRYVLFNRPSRPTDMSTQLTGNTCYFQTYL